MVTSNYIDKDEVMQFVQKQSFPKKIPLDVAKKLLLRSPELSTWVREDGTLTKYGIENIETFIDKHNRTLNKIEKDKKEKALLKETLAAHRNLIENIHKNKVIIFKVINNLPNNKIKLYKSPVHNRRQSSEYYLGVIEGEVYYIRKSNHWGAFYTNIYEVDEAMKELNISREEALRLQRRDPFARIGSKSFEWVLQGGRKSLRTGEYLNISQIGCVKLEDVIK